MTGQHHRHPEDRRSTRTQAWELRQVPDHRHERAGEAGERARATCRRPTAAAHVADAQARPEVRDVPEDLREPEHDDDADHARRQRQPGAVPAASSTKWQAGQGRRPRRPGSPDVDKQIDAQLKNARPGTRRRRDEHGRRARRAAGLPDRRRARRRAAWRRRGPCCVHEPVAPRLRDLLRLPAGHDARTSRSRTTTCSRRRAGSGSRTTSTCSTTDQQIWPAVREHALADRGRGAAAGAVRVRRRADARRGRGAGVGLLPHGLLPARAGAAGRRDARLRLPAQPRHRAGEQRCSASSGSTGRCGSTRRSWSKPSLRAARPVGHRQHDDHLPGRAARRAEAPVRVGRARRRRRLAAACAA